MDHDNVKYVSCFAGNIQCPVGYGIKIPFWLANWLGDQCLLNRFPNVFQAAIMK